MFDILPNKKIKILGIVAILLGIVDYFFPEANVSIQLGDVILDDPSEFITTGATVFLGRDVVQKFQPIK